MMSKIFIYGSELQELEQLMMLVPNFFPRRNGVIVVQRIRNVTDPLGFERSSELITEYCKSKLESANLCCVSELYDLSAFLF